MKLKVETCLFRLLPFTISSDYYDYSPYNAYDPKTTMKTAAED